MYSRPSLPTMACIPTMSRPPNSWLHSSAQTRNLRTTSSFSSESTFHYQRSRSTCLSLRTGIFPLYSCAELLLFFYSYPFYFLLWLLCRNLAHDNSLQCRYYLTASHHGKLLSFRLQTVSLGKVLP